MSDTHTIYAAIHNHNDGLPQARWTVYHRKFVSLIRHHALEVYAEWVTPFGAPHQSACVNFEAGPDAAGVLRHDLASLAGEYQQDSITWAHAKTRLLTALAA